jgi:hypothetical protein
MPRFPILALALVAALPAPVAAQQRSVLINRVRLAEQDLTAIEERWATRIPDGNYWYDKFSGAWGMEGGPTAGWIPAGLELGGPLRADASRGNTGVFINGRELHALDVAGLMQITPVYQGRWWVDALGNFGAEGGPALGNLRLLAAQRGIARVLRPGRPRRPFSYRWSPSAVAAALRTPASESFSAVTRCRVTASLSIRPRAQTT